MTHTETTGVAAQDGASAAFVARPPSQSWEHVAVDFPPHYVWVWFKPPALPQGLIARIPEEAYQGDPQPESQPTLRRILAAAGIDPAGIASWVLQGTPYDAAGGTNPYLDAPIPATPAGVDPNIAVYVNVPAASGALPAPPMQPMPQMPVAAVAAQSAVGSAVPATAAESFERIDADWRQSLDIEKELKRLRKRLNEMLGKLKSLNRDLTPLERLHSDHQDKRDWRDARRALRDCSTRVWACMKSFDIGDTSSAGRKNTLEHTYQTLIAARQPFNGLEQVQRDFEAYRKAMTTLQGNMNNALSVASTQGERRAQSILTRIGNKIRDAQTKRNFLGVMID